MGCLFKRGPTGPAPTPNPEVRPSPGGRARDPWLTAFGAILGIGLSAAFCGAVLGWVSPWYLAPMGASAVLLFAVPASPLAQPWPVVGGNLVSAAWGMFVAVHVTSPPLALGVAVGGAIAIMALLRCLHPPGGAMALTAVLGGGDPSGWFSKMTLAVLSTTSLLAFAWCFHRLLGQRYPNRPILGGAPPQPSGQELQLKSDLQAVLSNAKNALDVDPDDLLAIVRAVERRAAERLSKGGTFWM